MTITQIRSTFALLALALPVAAHADAGKDFLAQGAAAAPSFYQATDFSQFFTGEAAPSIFISESSTESAFDLTAAGHYAAAARAEGNIVNVEADPTPEPATMGLMAMGLAALAGARRRNRIKTA